MKLGLLTLLPLALSGCMFGPPPVTRVVGGRELVGRYISPKAYASYAEGAYLEAKGDRQQAERKYREALAEDPDSAAIWTRLGALGCQRSQADADRAFGRARAIDASYAPLWRETARCELSHGQTDAALASGKKAFALDPDDEQTTVLLAELFARRGQRDTALRWLDALVLRDPDSLAGWRALLSTAHAAGDHEQELRAARALIELAPGQRTALRRRYPALHLLAAADRALLSGDMKEARQRALAAHLTLGDLAVQAARLGLPKTAASLADTVLRADPDDANAWIARLVAADLTGDQAAFDSALDALGHSPVTPRPAAARLLGALLERRAGKDAAHRWLSAYGLAKAKKPPAGKPASAPLSE